MNFFSPNLTKVYSVVVTECKLRIKGIILLGIIALTFTVSTFAWPVSPATIPENGYTPAPIHMTITINGLAQGETATLLLGLNS